MKPVEDALAKAGITADQVDIVELLGGGIRVPRIQELLQARFGEGKELGAHLNGDEAMCFGSAFIASNSSASFKVRKVYLTQHPFQPLSIRISPVNVSKVEQEVSEETTTTSDSEELTSTDADQDSQETAAS